MIADASALAAILLREPDAGPLLARLLEARAPGTHAVSLYEAATALSRETKRPMRDAERIVRGLLDGTGTLLHPIGSNEVSAALQAFARYGKGRHPAALNMGDCFSYACAKLRGVPLLYKGDDFARTDLA